MEDRFKFRAYIKAEKRMGQVKSIDFWRSKGTICENGSLETHSKGDGLIVYRGLDEVEPIMQCTGLKDKNGKLVYDGDIVKNLHNGKTYQCYWGNYSASWLFCNVKEDFDFYDFANINQSESIHRVCEIIGNIYENPELLEGGAECQK